MTITRYCAISTAYTILLDKIKQLKNQFTHYFYFINFFPDKPTIKNYTVTTEPYKPQQNGKIERFWQKLEDSTSSIEDIG